jgi:hypothetical protein
LTASYSGFVNGEVESVLTGSPALATTADASSTVAAGPYAITATVGTLTAVNYEFAFGDGSLTVTKAPTTTTASGANTPYSENDQTVTLSATITDAPVNEGTVTFAAKQGATTLGSPVTSGLVTGGVASVSYTVPGGTPKGSYLIEADYSGGDNLLASADHGKVLLVGCSNAPVASADSLGSLKNHSVTVGSNKLLANDTATDTTTLVAVSATSTNGGTVTFSGGAITYTPATNFTGADLFTYTLTDDCSTVTGSVVVVVAEVSGLSENLIGDIVLDAQGAHARFAAIPTFTYSIERSTNAVDWTPLQNVTAPESGLIEFLDPAPPAGPVYYRTVTP